jgi:hypothetical protein
VIHESKGRKHIEELCNNVNEAKLQQANTSFTTRALQDDDGWLGIGPVVCMMLDGTYEPHEEVYE